MNSECLFGRVKPIFNLTLKDILTVAFWPKTYLGASGVLVKLFGLVGFLFGLLNQDIERLINLHLNYSFSRSYDFRISFSK